MNMIPLEFIPLLYFWNYCHQWYQYDNHANFWGGNGIIATWYRVMKSYVLIDLR